MTPAELRALLERRGAMLAGHFVLSSGLHSDRFIQKFRIFEDPPTAEAVGAALADLLHPSNPEVVVFKVAPAERVAVVEDVMTTGKSVGEVIEVVRAAEGEVVAIGAVVKRGVVDLPLPVSALLDLPLADYSPEECPQCRAGVPLEDPGSRRSS